MSEMKNSGHVESIIEDKINSKIDDNDKASFDPLEVSHS